MTTQHQVTGINDLEGAFREIATALSGRGKVRILKAGAEVIRDKARDNAIDQGLFDEGDLVESIEVKPVNQYRVDVIVGVPYGAAHEFGTTVTITEKQRSFFWAKFNETQDPMWKALALSKTYTIKARPYLRPAIDSEKKAAAQAMADALFEELRRVLR